MKYEVNEISNVKNNYGKEVLKNRGVEDLEAFLNPTKEHSL